MLVGKVSAERLIRWAHQNGWTFDLNGLRKLARARGARSMEIDEDLARFVADAVQSLNEPAHDYTRFNRNGRTINRRTLLMLKAAEGRLGGELRLAILKGSYVRTGRRGAHPHMGGGVVDLVTDRPEPQCTERAVQALREVGFAAWYRARESDSHIHAVAIGDREMTPAAWWQVKAYFLGRDGRTRGEEDAHRSLTVSLPAWVARYRVAAL
jgi:hypothetical protein